MLYRKFGKTNEEVSILGYGCMRFPVLNQNDKEIDEENATKQIRYAIDNGVNYIDTAYIYHGKNSESFLGKALKDGYRERVKLATKLPCWYIKEKEDMDKILDEQLAKLDTEYIDFYLVHALDTTQWEKMKNLGLFEFLEKAKESGKIKHIGFSFHDELPLFKEIVDSYDWEFTLIQYNFMDENYQAGKEGLKYASEKGLGIAIMEPLRGGSLVKIVPDDVKKVWDKSEIKRKPSQWAFRFLWDHPEVNVVLSGMGEMSQIEENIETAKDAYPNSLTTEEKKIIEEVKNIYNSKMVVNCTNCKYCMPCPVNVNIPTCFTHLNNASMFEDVGVSKNQYNMFLSDNEKAHNCIDCGACEAKCPQHIEIRTMLKAVQTKFAN